MQNFESAEKLTATIEKHKDLLGDLFGEVLKFTQSPIREIHDKIELTSMFAETFNGTMESLTNMFMMADMLDMTSKAIDIDNVDLGPILEELVPQGVKAMTEFALECERIRGSLYFEVYQKVCQENGEEEAQRLLNCQKSWEEASEFYGILLDRIKDLNV